MQDETDMKNVIYEQGRKRAQRYSNSREEEGGSALNLKCHPCTCGSPAIGAHIAYCSVAIMMSKLFHAMVDFGSSSQRESPC